MRDDKKWRATLCNVPADRGDNAYHIAAQSGVYVGTVQVLLSDFVRLGFVERVGRGLYRRLVDLETARTAETVRGLLRHTAQRPATGEAR